MSNLPKKIISIAKSLPGIKYPLVTGHSGDLPGFVKPQLVDLSGRPLVTDFKNKGWDSKGHLLFNEYTEKAYAGELTEGIHTQHVVDGEGAQHLYLYVKEHPVDAAIAKTLFSRRDTSLNFFKSINGYFGCDNPNDAAVQEALKWNASKDFRGETLALREQNMINHEALLRETMLNGGNINNIPTVGFLGPNFVHLSHHRAIIDDATGKYIHQMTPMTDWHHSMFGVAHQGVIYNPAQPGKYRVVIFGYGNGLTPFADRLNNWFAPYIWPVAGERVRYVNQYQIEKPNEPFADWLREKNKELHWESVWMNLAAGFGGDLGVTANMFSHKQDVLERLEKPRFLELTKENQAQFKVICENKDVPALVELASKAPEATGEYREGGLWDGKTHISITDSITGGTSYQNSTLAMGSPEASTFTLQQINEHLQIELSPKRRKEKFEAVQKDMLKVATDSGRTFVSAEEAAAFIRSNEGVQSSLGGIYQDAIDKYSPQITSDVIAKEFTLEDGTHPDAAMVNDFLKVATQEVYVAPMIIPEGDGELLITDVAEAFVVDKIQESATSKADFEAVVIKAEQSVAESKLKVDHHRKALEEAKNKAESESKIEENKRKLESAEREYARRDKEHKDIMSTKHSLEKSPDERSKEKKEHTQEVDNKIKKRIEWKNGKKK
ncbi:hypothetical protein Trisim1_005943 [Trichoderma cf. simile WF8]